MTREEAIANLKMISVAFVEPVTKEQGKLIDDTFDMAINALEQEPCEDAISREPFTDSTICEGFSCNECSFNRKDKGGCILEERVKALPSVTPQPKTGRWIPVSERLPENSGEYICTMSNDNVQECGFVPSGEKGLISGWSTCEADGFKRLEYRDIKAWMPLPEPYKAEGSDKE